MGCTDGQRGRVRILYLTGLLVLVLVQLGSGATPSSPYIAVANYSGGNILTFDAATGAPLGAFGSFPTPLSEFNRGPDGKLYVTVYSYSDDYNIYRIDPATGASGRFVNGSGYGGIRGMSFGPNGDLFVAAGKGAIIEFDGVTGQYKRDFISGIATPIDLAFAPNGTLYVARGHQEIPGGSSILRFDGHTGASLGTFAATHVDTPQNIFVGPDGDVYVTNQWFNAEPLVKFDGVTGAVKFTASAGLNNPQGMDIGLNNELLVASWDNTIKRFDAISGAYLGDLVQQSGVDWPTGVIAFIPEPSQWGLLPIGTGILALAHRFGRDRRQNAREAAIPSDAKIVGSGTEVEYG